VVDPKVAADQRGHAIGVAIDTYTESDLKSRLEAVTKLELALADRKPAESAAAADSASKPGFQGKRGKRDEVNPLSYRKDGAGDRGRTGDVQLGNMDHVLFSVT